METSMWKIFRSEMSYNGYVSRGGMIFLLFMCLLFFLSGSSEVQVYVAMIALLLTPMIGGYAWDFRAKQRRDYFFSKLAVPIRQLAILRLFYTVVLWVLAAALFGAILLVFSLIRAAVLAQPVAFSWFYAPTAMNLLWLNGWILAVNAAYMIVTDKKADRPDEPIAFFYESLKYVIPLLAMTPFYLAVFVGEMNGSPPAIEFFKRFFSSPLSVVLVNAAGVGLSFLSVRVFAHRGSYTHS